MAHIKAGYIVEADSVLASLDRFQNYPEDNMTILAAAGALMTGRTKEAREYLNAAKGEYTPALQRFVDSLNLLLVPQKAKKTGADENTCAFYLMNFFGQKDPKAKAEALMLKLQEEKKEKNRKTILFALCVILSIIPLVWVSIGGWESMGRGSILAGAIVAAGVGVGTLGIVVGDEKQWKAILFRSVFALIALGLMIKSIISGTFGFSSICFSFFSGLWCTGFVMAFSKPSFFE